ncbi:CWF19-like protein 2 [Iris pallida]|uniref:CWF19-like protein 2 n=1 Tax=Iris pallida TaxID=29817 RepID=A0AAX6EV04_IRIPA|nr:CWF19-like protein 2 [Iris pallida]
MLSGIKFIPRDQLLKPSSSDSESAGSEEEEKGSKKKRSERKKEKRRKKEKKSKSSSSKSKKSEYSSDSDPDSSSSESTGNKRRRRKKKKKKKQESDGGDDNDRSAVNRNERAVARKEMGLEWMLSSGSSGNRKPAEVDNVPEDSQVDEVKGANPRELNPYLRDSGSGYPDDTSASVAAAGQLLSSSVVGDGGASWRLKALKRAKEQAAREGRKLDEVVEERWDSLGHLAASVATRTAAPSRAHLRAIKDRKMGQIETPETDTDGAVKGVAELSRRGAELSRRGSHDYLRDVSSRHPEMRKPKQDSFQWKSKRQNMSSEDSSLIASALSGLNKFSNDGSFMDSVSRLQGNGADGSSSSPRAGKEVKNHRGNDLGSSEIRNSSEVSSVSIQGLTANQLAAKVLQLRMKGKVAEAEKLSKEMEAMTDQPSVANKMIEEESQGSISRFVQRQISSEKHKREDDADLHLAQKIMQNKLYSISGRADDEYDFDGDAPSKKRNRKREAVHEEKRGLSKRMLTQQERCQFCFENPSRPKHLVVSIGNFTYMMLPQWQPVVEGHCCILPMQHDSASRNVDKNVWEEIRNFKKCLLKMFAGQEKDVVFIETVIGLARQRRHCLIECIPVPYEVANLAPMYFKKGIDEAEDEWGQHEMKKVIPTSGNLRNVIPENLAYFHVEFGLDRGFAHVIDDDGNFPSSFGLNVIRGLLELPEEDMHRRRRQEPVDKQKQAVVSFAREWEPFDWTKGLD